MTDSIDLKNHRFFDIETDGLDATRIWCIGHAHGEVAATVAKGIHASKTVIGQRDKYCVGHNILNFDIPTIHKLTGVECLSTPIDTFIMSRLLYGNTLSSHSLEAWGERLNFPKGEHSDWSRYSDEMAEYCKNDVEVTRAVYVKLAKAAKFDARKFHKFRQPLAQVGFYKRMWEDKSIWAVPLWIEHRFAEMIVWQVKCGWKVDEKKMHALLTHIDQTMFDLRKNEEPKLGDTPLTKTEEMRLTPPRNQFLKNGNPSKACYNFFDTVEVGGDGYWYGTIADEHGVNMCIQLPAPSDKPVFKTKPLKFDNLNGMKKYLLAKGWKPTWWNEDSDGNRTTPKMKNNGILCPNLVKLGETVTVVKAFADFLTYRHRKGLIEGLLDVIRPDGKIPSECVTCGTATGRVSHRKIANFPNVESTLGKEIRDCFIAEDGRVLVSTDADSCQLRMLASRLIEHGESVNHPYIHAILHGTKEDDNDAHCIARDLAGLSSRSQGKTLNYAILFGQSDKAMAQQIGVPVEQAKAIKEKFFSNLPALPKLMKHLKREFRRSAAITGLDGRLIRVDSEHKLLNYLLQSDEAILMKVAYVYTCQKVQSRQLDAHPVCFYHDEYTFDSDPKCARRVGEIQERSLRVAGLDLGVNVPTTGSHAIGKTWADVH